jgi:hypothetical protein
MTLREEIIGEMLGHFRCHIRHRDVTAEHFPRPSSKLHLASSVGHRSPFVAVIPTLPLVVLAKSEWQIKVPGAAGRQLPSLVSEPLIVFCPFLLHGPVGNVL